MKKVKKIVALSLIMAVLLTSCQKNKDNNSSSDPNSSETQSSSGSDSSDSSGKNNEVISKDITGFKDINLNKINFNQQKVKSVLTPINVNVDEWYNPIDVRGDIIYIDTFPDDSDPNSRRMSAVSLETGEVLNYIDNLSFYLHQEKISTIEYMYDYNDINNENLEKTEEKNSNIDYENSEPPALKSIDVKIYDSKLEPIDEISITENLSEYMSVVYLEKNNSVAVMNNEQGTLLLIELNTKDTREITLPEIKKDSNTDIIETNDKDIISICSMYYSNESEEQFTQYFAYNLNDEKIVGEVITKNQRDSKAAIYHTDFKNCHFYSYDNDDDASINGFVNILVESNTKDGLFCGKGTFGSDSITEMAIFDIYNGNYKTTIPDVLNAYPSIVISENKMVINYFENGKTKYGVLEFTSETDDYASDSLDFSQETLESFSGKTLPFVSADLNWGSDLKQPTNYSVFSDIALTFSHAAIGVRSFDENYEIIDNKNPDELATQFVLEIMSSRRYEKNLEDYAVLDPNTADQETKYYEYRIDYDEVNSIVKKLFPNLGADAVKFNDENFMRQSTSLYDSGSNQYIISPKSAEFTGNMYGDYALNNVSINSIKYDESTSTLTMDFDFYLQIDYDEQVAKVVLDAKVDTKTGSFEILNFIYE